jgi:hypothetical protein
MGRTDQRKFRSKAKQGSQASPDEPRSKLESVRSWLAAVAIPVVLAVLGLWQFVLREVWWPAAAINLTAEASIKQAGFASTSSSQGKAFEAIELVVNARNPSAKTIYLLPNHWVAWGFKIDTVPKEDENPEKWLENANDLINSMEAWSVGKHYRTDDGTLVAMGSAIEYTSLRPNEQVSETHVFHVPQGVYDLVEVAVDLPYTPKENPDRYGEAAIGVEYKLNGTNFDVSSIYLVGPDGGHKALPRDWDGGPRQSDARRYDLQSAVARVALSLWESKPPPQHKTEPPETSP